MASILDGIFSSGSDPLEDAQTYMENLETKSKRTKEFVKNFQEVRDKKYQEKQELSSKKEELQKECAKLQNILDRETSASRDARKMYGDLTPGDITHQDVTLAYQNHFKEAFRNLPKEMDGEKKYDVWKKINSTIMASFEQNKEMVIRIIHDELIAAFKRPSSKSPTTLEERESMNDLSRAFSMLVKDAGKLERIRRNIQTKLEANGKFNSELAKAITDMAVQIMTSIEPHHHSTFFAKASQEEKITRAAKSDSVSEQQHHGEISRKGQLAKQSSKGHKNQKCTKCSRTLISDGRTVATLCHHCTAKNGLCTVCNKKLEDKIDIQNGYHQARSTCFSRNITQKFKEVIDHQYTDRC